MKIRETYFGMTLRQWYAGMALSGMKSNLAYDLHSPAEFAYIAFRQADAMLAIEEKESREQK